MRAPAPTTTLQDQDMTETQGFESAGRNVIFVYPGDCPHCLKPAGTVMNVFTSYGKDQWCANCAKQGEIDGTCVLESKLSKKDAKLWEKKLKKEGKL